VDELDPVVEAAASAHREPLEAGKDWSTRRPAAAAAREAESALGAERVQHRALAGTSRLRALVLLLVEVEPGLVPVQVHAAGSRRLDHDQRRGRAEELRDLARSPSASRPGAFVPRQDRNAPTRAASCSSSGPPAGRPGRRALGDEWAP